MHKSNVFTNHKQLVHNWLQKVLKMLSTAVIIIAQVEIVVAVALVVMVQ